MVERTSYDNPLQVNVGDYLIATDTNKKYVYKNGMFSVLDNAAIPMMKQRTPLNSAPINTKYNNSVGDMSKAISVTPDNTIVCTESKIASRLPLFEAIDVPSMCVIVFCGISLVTAICYNSNELACTIAGGLVGFLSKSTTVTNHLAK